MDPGNNFSTLFEFLPIGAYRSRADGQLLRANPALVRMEGFESEAQYLSASRAFCGDWYVKPGRRAEFLGLLARDGRVVAFESLVRRRGSDVPYWVREHAHQVRDANGQTLYHEGTVEDITAEMTNRQELQISRDRFEQMVQIVPAIFYRMEYQADGSREVTFVNDQSMPILGVDMRAYAHDLNGWIALIHPDDRARVKQAWSSAKQTRGSLRYQCRLCPPDGSIKWVQLHSVSVSAPDQPEVRVGMIIDITRQHQVEDELRENSELWKRALQASGDGVWDWRIDHDQLWLSPECKAMYGYEPHELLDGSAALNAMSHPDDLERIAADRSAHLEGLTPTYINERRVRCKDGRWKTVLSRGVVIQRDTEGRPLRMIGTHTDVSEARQADRLRQERDRAAAADLAKSQFLSRVSHELRTPLNAILGFSQLLDMDANLADRHRGWVRHVLQSGDHLLALVEDVLDLSSVQTGQLSFRIEPVDLWPLVDEVCAMLAASAKAMGVTLGIQREASSSVVLLADRKRLKQVLINLVSNAIKFNHQNGWVRIDALRHGQAVEVNVTDGGPGIASDQLDRLFHPFERANAQQRGITGIGLGLALSRQLAESMGGGIGVTSVAGQGARFSVRLPGATLAGPGAEWAPESTRDATVLAPSGDTNRGTAGSATPARI